MVVDVGGAEREERRPSHADHRLRQHQDHHVRSVVAAAPLAAPRVGRGRPPARRSQPLAGAADVVAGRHVGAQAARVRVRYDVRQDEHERADTLQTCAQPDPDGDAPPAAEEADRHGETADTVRPPRITSETWRVRSDQIEVSTIGCFDSDMPFCRSSKVNKI